MPRWITITQAPFDYVWPGRSAITHFDRLQLDTEHFVKEELADYAVGKGYAREGRIEGSTAKSDKGVSAKPKRVRRKKREAVPSNRVAIEQEEKAPAKAKTKALTADNTEIDAIASKLQPDSRVDGESDAEDGASSNGSAMDSVSG